MVFGGSENRKLCGKPNKSSAALARNSFFRGNWTVVATVASLLPGGWLQSWRYIPPAGSGSFMASMNLVRSLLVTYGSGPGPWVERGRRPRPVMRCEVWV